MGFFVCIAVGCIVAVIVTEVISMRADKQIPHQASCACASCADFFGDQALSADEVELINLRRRNKVLLQENADLRAALEEKSVRLLRLEASRDAV